MLLVDQPFRITDDVYEQDMGNLQSKIGFRFGHGTTDVVIRKRPTSNQSTLRNPKSAIESLPGGRVELPTKGL